MDWRQQIKRDDPISPHTLRAALQSLEITQAVFAKAVGVNARTARRWLSGETELSGAQAIGVRFTLLEMDK